MASITCTACKAKKANRPGKLCYACWVEAGKPTAEEAHAKADRDRTYRERPARVDSPDAEALARDANAALADEVEPDAAAMRYVWDHGKPRTHQQQRFAAMLAQEGPAKFYALLVRVEAGKPADAAVESPAAWDGKGPCPCCGHEPEQPIEDEGTDKILTMLDELDAREAK